jgi:F-type H+-transporting ATPase subunit b
MDPKLQRQVGELVISSLPTLFLFFFLYLYLKRFFFSRIERVLEERRQATSGTREAAAKSLKHAEGKAAEYEEKLRAARTEIYKEQEEVRRKWRDEQAAGLAASRERTDSLLKGARASLEAQTVEAKASLGAESEALAEQIARSILSGRMN